MVESAGVWMPLGLAYLAGSLEAAGYEVFIYDAMSRFDDIGKIAATLERHRPDVVATTAYTATVNAATDVLRAAKRLLPGVVTVIGGVHPTLMAAEVLGDRAVDYVVRGEGEATLPELLDCLVAGGDVARVAGVSHRADGGVVHAPDRPLACDLDGLPVAWDAIDWPLYHYRTKPGSRLAIVSWSRGCTNGCRFCSQRLLWRGTWRARSVDSIVAELRMLKERYGVDTVEVADEHPTYDAARWETILDRLIAEDLGIELLGETRADDVVRDAAIVGKYRDAGFLHMYVGVESPIQGRLDWMRKGIRIEQSRDSLELLNAAGIITETSFLLGHPDETPQTIAETVRLAGEYAPDLAFFLAITPWPYTELYREVADRVEVRDYSKYNLIEPIIRPYAMSRAEVTAAMNDAFREFYARKMSALATMPANKQRYLKAVTRLLMEESYLAGEVSSVAGAGAHGHPAGADPDGRRAVSPERHPSLAVVG
jgi:anaerobic magnesium-protoporphyrin IX monomethyl ester cyclase